MEYIWLVVSKAYFLMFSRLDSCLEALGVVCPRHGDTWTRLDLNEWVGVGAEKTQGCRRVLS